MCENESKIMVFRPTMAEFARFDEYVKYIESQGAHKIGLAKIVAPPEWNPRKEGYNLEKLDIKISTPLQQIRIGENGAYHQLNVVKDPLTVAEFAKLANFNQFVTPAHKDTDDLCRKFWRRISTVPPIYGADVCGSLTDENQKMWNISNLGSILDHMCEEFGSEIEGVNTAYLYFGMWRTSFSWHTEDMDLYSINYLHFGAPKTWYVVPPEHGHKLEQLTRTMYPNNYAKCKAFMRHKMIILSPEVLTKHGIPYHRVTQRPREFMITFPYAYHSGFNHGFNCAESTNFALERWVEYGKRATLCTCDPEAIRINMDTFVKRFQHERYEAYISDADFGYHPEDPTKTLKPALRYELFPERNMLSEEPDTLYERNPDLNLKELIDSPYAPTDIKLGAKLCSGHDLSESELQHLVKLRERDNASRSPSPVQLHDDEEIMRYVNGRDVQDDDDDSDFEEALLKSRKRKTNADYDDDWTMDSQVHTPVPNAGNTRKTPTKQQQNAEHEIHPPAKKRRRKNAAADAANGSSGSAKTPKVPRQKKSSKAQQKTASSSALAKFKMEIEREMEMEKALQLDLENDLDIDDELEREIVKELDKVLIIENIPIDLGLNDLRPISNNDLLPNLKTNVEPKLKVEHLTKYSQSRNQQKQEKPTVASEGEESTSMPGLSDDVVANELMKKFSALPAGDDLRLYRIPKTCIKRKVPIIEPHNIVRRKTSGRGRPPNALKYSTASPPPTTATTTSTTPTSALTSPSPGSGQSQSNSPLPTDALGGGSGDSTSQCSMDMPATSLVPSNDGDLYNGDLSNQSSDSTDAAVFKKPMQPAAIHKPPTAVADSSNETSNNAKRKTRQKSPSDWDADEEEDEQSLLPKLDDDDEYDDNVVVKKETSSTAFNNGGVDNGNSNSNSNGNSNKNSNNDTDDEWDEGDDATPTPTMIKLEPKTEPYADDDVGNDSFGKGNKYDSWDQQSTKFKRNDWQDQNQDGDQYRQQSFAAAKSKQYQGGNSNNNNDCGGGTAAAQRGPIYKSPLQQQWQYQQYKQFQMQLQQAQIVTFHWQNQVRQLKTVRKDRPEQKHRQ